MSYCWDITPASKIPDSLKASLAFAFTSLKPFNSAKNQNTSMQRNIYYMKGTILFTKTRCRPRLTMDWQEFYWVDQKAKYILGNLPDWYDQLGSFDKNHISKHLNGILTPFIVSTSIKGITLKTLLQKHGIQQIDLLRIDCEGHDWKILRQLDLTRFKPSLILFEMKHLNREELKAALLFLYNDYQVYQFEGDFLCFSKVGYNELSKKDIKYLLDFHSIESLKNKL